MSRRLDSRIVAELRRFSQPMPPKAGVARIAFPTRAMAVLAQRLDLEEYRNTRRCATMAIFEPNRLTLEDAGLAGCDPALVEAVQEEAGILAMLKLRLGAELVFVEPDFGGK